MKSRPVCTEKVQRESLARKAALNAVNIEKRGANNPSPHLKGTRMEPNNLVESIT
jgi:hypothetical protein